MQQNSWCRLSGDRDETINHIIRECNKLARSIRQDSTSRAFKFHHTNKWYICRPEAIMENETHGLLWDFVIQTDHLISDRQLDLIIINEKNENMLNCRLYSPVDYSVKLKESEKKERYLGLAWEFKKKTVENERDGDTDCNWRQKVSKKTRGHWNKRMSGDHPNNSIVEIGQNAEKCPGDLRRLAVTQTPVKDYHLVQIWKTLKA